MIVEFASKWEVFYHEMLDISNTFQKFTIPKLGARKCDLDHELNGNYSFNNNKYF